MSVCIGQKGKEKICFESERGERERERGECKREWGVRELFNNSYFSLSPPPPLLNKLSGILSVCPMKGKERHKCELGRRRGCASGIKSIWWQNTDGVEEAFCKRALLVQLVFTFPFHLKHKEDTFESEKVTHAHFHSHAHAHALSKAHLRTRTLVYNKKKCESLSVVCEFGRLKKCFKRTRMGE